MNNTRVLLTCSRKLAKHPALAELTGAMINFISSATHYAKGDAVLAWGRKPSSIKAAKLAKQLNLPLWYLEDGFIHSLGQGVLGHAACSLVIDHTGIYYDATTASDLERLLASDPDDLLEDVQLKKRAATLIKNIVQLKVSKYNNACLDAERLQLPTGPKVLLADQTAGDMSLHYGLVNTDARTLVATALHEHPDATLLIKTHPDVIAGKKAGFFELDEAHPRIRVIAENINPLVLLARVDHVYVLTSQLGFEALLLGKPVTCFGVPFYAGWGLTDDRADPSHSVFQRRQRRRSLTEVFAASYLLYSRYVHPDTAQPTAAESIVAYFGLQNQLFSENQGRLFAFGFSRWKRNYLRRFLYAPGNELNFVASAAAAQRKNFDRSSHIIVWGERAFTEVAKLAQLFDTPIWRVEDGFLRSTGLGSDYTPPLSLVLDKRGIYYDPNQPSDLEHWLAHYEFDEGLLARAGHLRKALLEHALSKYNLGEKLLTARVKAESDQRIILVPGQVEDDASIQKGCLDIADNTALLHAVRESRPHDYVIYKPHPDVVSGNRKGRVAPAVLQRCCDLVLDDVSITDCLEIAAEVHTMTSLVGFEGLLRNKRVVCYGLPFYAGWGLTQDRHIIERRSRRVSVDQLVAATLILYPRYINWETGAFTTPEFTVETLRRQLMDQGGKKKNKVHMLKRLRDKVAHIYHGVFNFRY